MYKYYLIAILLVFSGCSNMKFNASMCDKIATDPNAIMPQECKNYKRRRSSKKLLIKLSINKRVKKIL